MKTNNSSNEIAVWGNVSERALKGINPAGEVAIGFTCKWKIATLEFKPPVFVCVLVVAFYSMDDTRPTLKHYGTVHRIDIIGPETGRYFHWGIEAGVTLETELPVVVIAVEETLYVGQVTADGAHKLEMSVKLVGPVRLWSATSRQRHE